MVITSQSRKIFELKNNGRLGPEDKIHRRIRVLNRVVGQTSQGIRCEADLRHADIVTRRQGRESDSRSLSVPGEKRSSIEEGEDEKEVSKDDARKYRRLAARGVYLARTVRT